MLKNKRLLHKIWQIVMLFTMGCGLFSAKQSLDKNKAGIDLIFKYGVGVRNVLNTFEESYTKDMVMDSSIIIALSLTEEELNKINEKMVEINFFGYPDTFSIPVDTTEVVGYVTPYSTYYFKVKHLSGIKELLWVDNIFKEDEKAEKLREFIEFIRGIIESKDEYKKLPPVRGGYL